MPRLGSIDRRRANRSAGPLFGDQMIDILAFNLLLLGSLRLIGLFNEFAERAPAVRTG